MQGIPQGYKGLIVISLGYMIKTRPTAPRIQGYIYRLAGSSDVKLGLINGLSLSICFLIPNFNIDTSFISIQVPYLVNLFSEYPM